MSSTTTTRTGTGIKIGSIAAVGVAALIAINAVIPSGATYVDTESARVDIATATFDLAVSDANDTQKIDLDFNNLKPGDTLTEKFVVTNNSSIAGVASLGSNFTNATPAANVDYNLLSVGVRPEFKSGQVGSITPAPTVVGSTLNPVTQLPASWDLGTLKPGQSATFYVDVKLDSSADKSWAGQQFGGNIPVTLTQK